MLLQKSDDLLGMSSNKLGWRCAVAFDDAQRMGYKVTIVPGMLFKAVIAVCDATLEQMKEMGRHPTLDTSMTVRDAFRRGRRKAG